MNAKTTPKDFFLHVGAIVALYTSAISLINLLFEIVNIVFPDRLSYSYVDPYSSGLRWAIAMLIIMFPAYLILGKLINKTLTAEPEKLNLWVRRWLSYLTLFIAGLTIAIDLVTLVNSFLGGELTSRFVSKVAIVLVVAGIVFSYYLFDIKRVPGGMNTHSTKYLYGSIVLILASLIYGFTVMGSPSTARDMRFDAQRVMDLQNIQWQIVNYYQQKGILPENITALTDPISGFVAPVDPADDTAYEYARTGKLGFKLCAKFALPSIENESISYPKPIEPASTNEIWTHPAGTYCYDRLIDPGLYPVRTK